MAVVECEDGETGAVEQIGVGEQLCPAAAPAVGEHDARAGRHPLRRNEPPSEACAVAAGEGDLFGGQGEVAQIVILHLRLGVEDALRDNPGDQQGQAGERGSDEYEATHHSKVTNILSLRPMLP